MQEKNNKENNQILNIKEFLEKEILYVKSEYENKLKEYNNIKEKISKLKETLKKEYKEYSTRKQNVDEKEKEIETLLLKISKISKNFLLSVNKSINKKFYNNLEGILGDKQKEKSFYQFFNFTLNLYNIGKVYHFQQNENINLDKIKELCYNNAENENNKNILKILRDETEIRNLILYLLEIFENLNKEGIQIYNKIKDIFLNIFNELNKEQKQYPIDLLYDYMKNIFMIIDFKNEVQNIKIILNNFIKEKNIKFIQIKNLESSIKEQITNKKIISNYLKTLNSFFFRIREEITKKDDEKIIKELLEDIEKYKKMISNNNKLNNNIDAMTSLTICTNYSFSDKSLIKNKFLENQTSKENLDNENKNANEENNSKEKKKTVSLIKPKKNNIPKNYLNVKKGNKQSIKNQFQNINKIINESKRDSKNENKRNYLKRSKNGNINDINDFHYKTLNKIASLTKQKFHNIETNKTKFKTQQKKYNREKSFNKNNKSLNLKQNSKNNKEKVLIPELKSQKIVKIKMNKGNIRTMKENKNIHKLNNIIFNNNTKEYYINKNNENNHSLNKTGNSKANKTQIFQRKSQYLSSNKDKNLNNSDKKKENELIKDKSFVSIENLIKMESSMINSSNKPKNEEKILKKEIDNNIKEINIENKENKYNNDSLNINEIKDSICDEMISKNYEPKNCLINPTNNNYINKLGIQQNIVWSENLYNNKIKKSKQFYNKKLNIEKSIDAFACCTSCT